MPDWAFAVESEWFSREWSTRTLKATAAGPHCRAQTKDLCSHNLELIDLLTMKQIHSV